MNSLLYKLLKKKGLESIDELDDNPLPDGSPSEKQTFEDYRRILSKKELTTKDIKEFCESQLGVIESRWQDLSVKNKRKAELIPYHTVYKTLLMVMDSPKSKREQLEKQLLELTK